MKLPLNAEPLVPSIQLLLFHQQPLPPSGRLLSWHCVSPGDRPLAALANTFSEPFAPELCTATKARTLPRYISFGANWCHLRIGLFIQGVIASTSTRCAISRKDGILVRLSMVPGLRDHCSGITCDFLSQLRDGTLPSAQAAPIHCHIGCC